MTKNMFYIDFLCSYYIYYFILKVFEVKLNMPFSFFCYTFAAEIKKTS
jgi:hypothetical protein